ncbi:hypothetical protein [Alteraurantiacibacter buctensis]|uniref:Uncharacterized protein n=1 Tax=Alteraurantiacibacter buctensis TaxID=1503981 RepID=A0A844YWW0_9SPHN|nr:hypothetical protein [Alteraurantiacibacter buctensis]MXO71622.1 hypothetical protein [Alteraurantiacibacter buctensis]
MNRVARWIVCALCLALAPVLLFQGQANANRPSGPFLTTNGFNLAGMARAGLRVRETRGTTTLTVEPAALRMARRAFAREPLAGDALFVMAIDERANVPGGEGEQALLDAAAAMIPRSRYLGALQVEQFSRRGDFTRTFAVIDRLARVYPGLTSEFVQPLVEALRQDDALDVMATALAGNPVWAREFWLAVPGDPELVGRMFALRQRVDSGTDATTDARLMAGLVGAGRFDDAIAFRDSLPAGRPQGTGFVSFGGEAPFGWNLEASGERAMNPQGDAGYDVFVQQDTSGVLGQQLLALRPGRYTFDATVTPVSSAPNLKVRLRCATARGDAGTTQPLGKPLSFSVTGACEAWWLEIMGDAWNLRDGLRATLSDMSFEAAR